MIVSKACDYIQSTTLSGLCGRPAVDKSLTHPVTELVTQVPSLVIPSLTPKLTKVIPGRVSHPVTLATLKHIVK